MSWKNVGSTLILQDWADTQLVYIEVNCYKSILPYHIEECSVTDWNSLLAQFYQFNQKKESSIGSMYRYLWNGHLCLYAELYTIHKY